MKKYLAIALTLMLVGTALISLAEVSPTPQKFNVKFTINYNAATLEEAAALEKRIKAEHVDACWVKAEVTESASVLTSTATGTVYFNEGTMRLQ